jgi:hypothetical protein
MVLSTGIDAAAGNLVATMNGLGPGGEVGASARPRHFRLSRRLSRRRGRALAIGKGLAIGNFRPVRLSLTEDGNRNGKDALE